MDFLSEGLVMGGHSVHLREESESGLARDRHLVTIDTLPDDVLVEIFDFYEYIHDPHRLIRQNTWHTLVHVCRRWRCIVFASPRRLNLRLTYRGNRPVSEILYAWPVLPLAVITVADKPRDLYPDQRWDNTVALLESENYNRICDIYIHMTSWCWEGFTAAMQKLFPELTHLEVQLRPGHHVEPVLPESFLGGSAPRLRSLSLTKIPFPSIPKLLLSAHRLVTLSLWFIPDSGYFPPDEMATALAVMTRLKTLHLDFHFPRSRPDSAIPPPTRIVLPALTELLFDGLYEYLEGLLARIDAPLLSCLRVTFSVDVYFDVPQLHRLIGHVEEFKTFDHAEVFISNKSIQLCLYPKTSHLGHRKLLVLRLCCRESGGKISSLAQVCSSSLPLISALEELEMIEGDPLWEDQVESAQWLELLDPFMALKNLYLTHQIAQRVVGALQELSRERAPEVLPALRNLFIQEFSSLQPVQEAMMPFVVARQISGRPVVVDHWKTEAG